MIRIVRSPITREELNDIARDLFGDLVKAVVDVRREVIAIGGELHADEEHMLIEDGSNQSDLWGINLYPGLQDESMIEFDSITNVRPSQENRSRYVEDAALRTTITKITQRLIIQG